MLPYLPSLGSFINRDCPASGIPSGDFPLVYNFGQRDRLIAFGIDIGYIIPRLINLVLGSMPGKKKTLTLIIKGF